MSEGTTPERKNLLAQIHIGAKNLGFEGESYRKWLENLSGFRSGSLLSDEQLKRIIEVLRAEGAFEEKQRGGKGIDRPTDLQWAKLAALGREMGWNGFKDQKMSAFVKKTVKIENPRFLTRKQISIVICGLEHWLKDLRGKTSHQSELKTA